VRDAATAKSIANACERFFIFRRENDRVRVAWQIAGTGFASSVYAHGGDEANAHVGAHDDVVIEGIFIRALESRGNGVHVQAVSGLRRQAVSRVVASSRVSA